MPGPSIPVSQDTVNSVGNAIATQEGYGVSSTNVPTSTNNPGDLGNTGSATKSYASPESGYTALYNQVGSMFSGSSSIYSSNMTLAQVGSHYAADPNWANGVASILGVSPNTTLAQIASGSVAINSVPQPQNTGNSNGSGSSTTSTTSANSTVANLTVDNSDPAAALPVAGMSIPDNGQAAALYKETTNQSLIIDSGLGQLAWYDDPEILQVTKPTKAVNYPVVFQIFFSTAQNATALPVSIKLMASIRTHQKAMRHVTTKQKTRTGVLVNLWGMATDTISGSASTGLMANQLGVTDYLSVSSAPPDIKQGILQAFYKDPLAMSSVLSNESQEGFFRVAAKDAFVELLSVFKNNGNVWFRNQNYTGTTTGQDQVDADAWSPITGSSTFQNQARRNDIMTRGRVVMSFRNATYSGYFKSLNWVMDAKNPFRWNFTFVFQVESTRIGVDVPVI